MRRRKGFTLIEVTLAIVIGIIMIAGSTLIYNQAKTAAGNVRASAKVVALQQMVEEWAAANQGIYPSSLTDMNALWRRKRPDDWNKSPWGGVLGASYLTQNNGVGTWNPSVSTSLISVPAGPALTPSHPASGTIAVTNPAGSLVGGLVYDYDPGNLPWTYGSPTGVGDIVTNGRRTVKGYSVYICDQQGRFPNFIKGGRPD